MFRQKTAAVNAILDSLDRGTLPGYSIDALIFDREHTRVYRAHRLSDGLPVMLKSLRNEQEAREASASLKHEYDMARRLQVSSVIRVYGLERHHSLPVVVLEDFGGESLASLAQQRRIPLPEVLAIAIQLAHGLGEIHAVNIIHKDINPSNVVYNPATGVVKIIDFGISTYLTREQAAIANPQVIVASLPYISPEQTGRMNRSIDYRSDFYSFGVTLFELLMGRLPFEVSEPIEWFHCHIAKQPQAPKEIDPAIPAAVSDIVMKLMAKMAEDRYQSASGIQADLQRCLDQLQQRGSIKPFVLGADDVPQRFQIPQRLYGREQEVTQLLTTFDRVSQGGNELILVSGYSGIGKTCLIREIYKPITERRGHFVAGKFDQLHRNVPYSAIAGALRDLVRQLLTETEERLQQWRDKIRAALGPNGQLMVDILRELELIIGPQPAVPAASPVEAEQRFHHVFLNFLQVFAQAEHPLVMFLDDLQWADNASLNMLEMITRPDSNITHLLLIGAYRDNEVQTGHPLLLSLNHMSEQGSPIEEIQLRPLQLNHLCALLADTLASDTRSVTPLAQLVQQKTAGNPFFTEEFLKVLHKEGLIRFAQDKRRWHWDVDQIQSQQMTDNVVELMTDKLRQLAPETLELMELAACIGNRFPLSMLAVVSEQTPQLIAQRLRSAMSEGVIAPIGDAYQLLELEEGADMELTAEFAFGHDRIQQAAYSLLDDRRRQQAHLQIGRLLLQRLPQDQQQERLFDITNHLNLGVALIADAQEKATLCQLNLTAGKRAKASTAYQAAYLYLATALQLLPPEPWQQAYELTLELHTEAAEATFLSADYRTMDTLLAAGLAHAKNLLDKVNLYLVQISALIAQGRLKDAVALARPVMAQLGHRYPASPTQGHVVLEIFKNLWTLRNVSMDTLAKLPQMTDPYHLAAHAIGARMGSAAMFVEPNLLSMMALCSTRIQYRHGHCEHALNSWAVYGMVLASELKQPEKGLAFGQLSLAMADRFQSRFMQARSLHVHNAMVRHWKEPLRNGLEPLQQAYRLTMENGDFEYAVLAVVVRMMNVMDAGVDLHQWHDELMDCYGAVKQLRQGNTLDYVAVYLQLCDNLTGKADNPVLLSGRYYDIDAKLKLHETIGDKSLIVMDLDCSKWMHYLFGDIEGALRYAQAMPVKASAVGGFFKAARSYMLDALIRLANVAGASKKQRRQLLRQVDHNRTRLKGWARHNPDNFRNKYCLVEAEWLRVQGHDFDAHGWFDEAIQISATQGFIHEQALASELCGAMHMAAGRTTLGLPYLAQARDLYQRWGAQAKVDDLLRRFPALVQAPHSSSGRSTSGTHTERMANIDITALMKALKSIAEEKVHSRMVESIIAAAVEFAAAQQGLLVLRNNEKKFCIEGEASVEGGAPRILQSLPVVQGNLPQTLFNYVMRTHASVVVHDAQQPFEEIPGLNLDPYVQQHRIRSLLCLPIRTGSGDDSELIGLLYLENNLATGTFTQERFDTLEIIVMAAAGRLELSRKASFDGLTGLYNHEYFQNMLRQEFASARRYQRPLGLILIDIDHFKQFNDTWGHQVGDLVLREVAQLIKASCRDSDVVARYGGEEMVIVMPSTAMPFAGEVAERIRALIEGHRIPHGEQELTVTISLGLAMLQDDTADKDALIRRADAALYRSKKNGRNQVTVD